MFEKSKVFFDAEITHYKTMRNIALADLKYFTYNSNIIKSKDLKLYGRMKFVLEF